MVQKRTIPILSLKTNQNDNIFFTRGPNVSQRDSKANKQK